MEEQEYWVLRISKRRVKYSAIAAVVIVLMYLFPFGTTCDYTDRTRTSAMLSLASGVKQQIGEFMLANPGKLVQMDARPLLPEDLDVLTKEGVRAKIAFRAITPKGEIQMFSPELGTMIVLTPVVVGKQVKWTCWGRPEKKVPANCRLK